MAYRVPRAQAREALADLPIPRRAGEDSELELRVGVRVVEAFLRGHGFPGLEAVERE